MPDAPLSIHGFPRAIVHIDGDAFFASCEQSRDPRLKGKPVVTGKERGIVASMSYEAKTRGVTRAMRLFEVKKLCPDAILLPSDYETYSLLSKRFFAIVRRYTPDVEEYGIDECFADLTGLRRPLRMNYITIAQKIKAELDAELGFTFSVGLAPTKVVAKIASKWKKPSGLTAIMARDIHLYIKRNRGCAGAASRGELWGLHGLWGTRFPETPGSGPLAAVLCHLPGTAQRQQQLSVNRLSRIFHLLPTARPAGLREATRLG